jgi:uncharacterized protein
MSGNKGTIERFTAAFNHADLAGILDCVTDEVEWIVPGVFHLKGKAAFADEMRKDGLSGSPVMTITRLTEESEVVVAEGTYRAAKWDGGTLDLVFCDVFELQAGRVRVLTTYLVQSRE